MAQNGVVNLTDVRLTRYWSRSGALLASFLFLAALIFILLLATFTYDVARDNAQQIATLRAAADRNYQLILEMQAQTQLLRDLRFRMVSDANSFRKELDSLRAESDALRKDFAALLRDLNKPR